MAMAPWPARGTDFLATSVIAGAARDEARWYDARMSADSPAEKKTLAVRAASTRLFNAIGAGDLALAREALEQGARPNGERAGRSMIEQAFMVGKEDMAVELLRAGAAPERLMDADAEPALHRAARKGWAKACEVLLERGVDPNAQDALGWTALHVACFHGRVGCVGALAKKCSLDLETHEGEACVDLLARAEIATSEALWSCMSILLDSGANVEARASKRASRGRSNGDLAYAFCAWGGAPRELCALACLGLGAKGVGQGQTGASALHHAAGAAMGKLARALVEAGADANALDAKGASPLHWLCLSRDPEVGAALETLEALRLGGADMSMPDRYGYLPFAQAIGADNAGVVEALAAMGMDLRARCEPEGRDAYGVAASARRPEMSEALDRGFARWERSQLEAGRIAGRAGSTIRM